MCPWVDRELVVLGLDLKNYPRVAAKPYRSSAELIYLRSKYADIGPYNFIPLLATILNKYGWYLMRTNEIRGDTKEIIPIYRAN